MRILYRRPLATACLAAMATAVGAFFLPLIGKLAVAVICLLAFLLCVFCRRCRGRLTLLFVLSLMLVILVQSAWYFDISARVPQSVAGSDCRVQCTVLEEESAGSGYAYYTVRVTEVNGICTDFRAALECGHTATFHVGDILEAEVYAQAPEEYYDRENLLYAIADGIRVGLISTDPAAITVISSVSMPWRQTLTRWRANLSSRLLQLSGKQNGGLAAALFLGDRDGLDPAISTYFRRSGVSHLLALSGMHVTLLLSMLTSLTVRLHLPKQGRLLLLAALAVFYLALTGFRISAIRAVGMVLMLYLADLVGTRHDPLTSLCAVGTLMLLVSPATVADGGFWMSFCAVFGLVTVLPPFNEWLKKQPISRTICLLVQAIAASAVAVVSVAMLSWMFCGEISPIGILITVVLTPLLTLILSLIPPLLLLDILPLFSAAPLAVPLNLLLSWMVGLTDRVAHLPNISVSLQVLFAGVILILMTVALFVMLILPLRRKIWLAIPPLGAVLAFAVCLGIWNSWTYDGQIRASYVVRSSGSALVLTEREDTIIIETSSGSFAMLRDAERASLDHGVTEIDSLILTHYHRAYIYSTERLAKRQIVRRVYLPLPQTESEYMILTAIRDRLSVLGTEIFCYESMQALKILENATYLRADAATIKRSTQPIVTYLVQTSAELLTFTNPSVQESEYDSTFRWIADHTDILILGEDGPNLKTVFLLPDTASPRLLLTDSADILPYLDLSEGSPFHRIPQVTDITRYDFFIQTS